MKTSLLILLTGLTSLPLFKAAASDCPQLQNQYQCERKFSFFEESLKWVPTKLELQLSSGQRLAWEFGSQVSEMILDGRTRQSSQFQQNTETKSWCSEGTKISSIEIFSTPIQANILRQFQLTKKSGSLQLVLTTSILNGNEVVDESSEHWKCKATQN